MYTVNGQAERYQEYFEQILNIESENIQLPQEINIAEFEIVKMLAAGKHFEDLCKYNITVNIFQIHSLIKYGQKDAPRRLEGRYNH